MTSPSAPARLHARAEAFVASSLTRRRSARQARGGSRATRPCRRGAARAPRRRASPEPSTSSTLVGSSARTWSARVSLEKKLLKRRTVPRDIPAPASRSVRWRGRPSPWRPDRRGPRVEADRAGDRDPDERIENARRAACGRGEAPPRSSRGRAARRPRRAPAGRSRSGRGSSGASRRSPPSRVPRASGEGDQSARRSHASRTMSSTRACAQPSSSAGGVVGSNPSTWTCPRP